MKLNALTEGPIEIISLACPPAIVEYDVEYKWLPPPPPMKLTQTEPGILPSILFWNPPPIIDQPSSEI